MSDFNRFAVEGMRQRWKKEGMQPRSINRDIQRLQSVLSREVKLGVLESSPIAGLEPMRADKTGRVRFLTEAEEGALREALEKREEKLRQARLRLNEWRAQRRKDELPEDTYGGYLAALRPLILIALNTGLRRGELLGLTWGAVNFPAKLLTVTAATAKSGHTRRLPAV